MDELAYKMRAIKQRLVSLEEDARQSPIAMTVDGPADEKICERTEGAATAVQAMHEDIFSAKRIQDGPKSLIIFGVKAEPPALSCRGDVLVDNGAAAPKSVSHP